MNLKQSYDQQKMRKKIALQMEREHDREVQEKLSRLMQHDKSESWREFQEKQKMYLERVQENVPFTEAKKDALINNFSVNGKLEH